MDDAAAVLRRPIRPGPSRGPRARPRTRTRAGLTVAVVAAALTMLAGSPASGRSVASAAAALPALPASWPSDRLELGLADAPGGAAALHATIPFGFRYQYLAGGVNTGNGWSTWNANAQFVPWYIADSKPPGMTAVFPYYMLLQSTPATGADEKAKDLSNLRNPTTMRAYFTDLRLFFAKANVGIPVVLHVEPDLWGYVEQGASRTDDATSVPAAIASSGDTGLADLPNTAAGFAKAIVRLRNQLAPNVILAYHLSVWGTNRDISISNDTNAQVDALAARAVTFYKSLGAAFDIAFTDIADRDASFKEIIYGDGGASRWDAADFTRYARFIAGFVTGSGRRMVVWQVPLGNTKMRAMNNTWGHYQDNRVEWFLDDPGGTHLALYRDAGVVGLFFGGGAEGTTCACDAIGDGVTNPLSINGNTRTSVSADDDGGYFRQRAAAYYATGGLTIGAPTTTWTLSGGATPASVARGATVSITATIKANRTTRERVTVDVYGPTGTRIARIPFGAQSFTADAARTFSATFVPTAGAAVGTYTVRVSMYRMSDGASLLVSNTHATTFTVHA